MLRTSIVAVIAHNVSVPLYNHRSKEFSERMYFMTNRFTELHIISIERGVGNRNAIPTRDESAPNLIVHKVHDGLVASNLDILRVARDVRADAIFADGIGDGASSLLCKREYGIPLITFVQGYETDLRAISLKSKLGMTRAPGFLSKILSLYDTIVLRSSDKVLCLSPGLIQYAKDLIPKRDWSKIEYIPHSLEYVKSMSGESARWADRLVSSLRMSNRNVILIMVVGTGLSKGTDIALRAHKYMVEKYPDSTMILVSKKIDPEYVRMVEKLKLQNSVLFLNSLPRDRVLALLSRSNVFLLPSFSEGSSWAIAEAMALGVPVVTYMNKSVKDAADKRAVAGITTTDPRDYARRCISLIEDGDSRKKLVQEAEDYIRPYLSFSEEKRLDLICEIIDQAVLARNPKPL